MNDSMHYNRKVGGRMSLPTLTSCIKLKGKLVRDLGIPEVERIQHPAVT